MLHTALRAGARAAVARGIHAATRSAMPPAAVCASRLQLSVSSVTAATSSPLGAASAAASAAPARRSFASEAGEPVNGAAAAASSSSDSDDGRQLAPAGEEPQGPLHQLLRPDGQPFSPNDPSHPQFNPKAHHDARILDVDPYPAEKLAALEKKYSWVDWNDMARHLHMADVHFFDEEVPYVDQDFTIKPDFRLLHRLEAANRLKRLQEQEDKKITRLLNFGFWVTQGRNVRVATEGKIQSVWTLVVAGDQNGTGSFGFGKGEDMVIAEMRAMQDLRRNMLFVPLFESRTLSHEVTGRHGVCQVRMWPRPRERGVTAGLIPRMLMQCFGITDITAKVYGRHLPHHQVLAVFNGLRQVKSLREEAIRRGVTAHRMFERALQPPRHPGREALDKRGDEVTDMLREVRAMQVQDDMLRDSGLGQQLGKKPLFYYPPLEKERFENPKEDHVWNESVLGYIQRKPEPIDAGAHNPAPKYPNNKRPAWAMQFYETRGLPHPLNPRSERPQKVL